MIEILTDPVVLAVIAIAVLAMGSFIGLCVRIKIVDSRSAKKREAAQAQRKARLSLIKNDGTEVDMTPYVRDVSFGPESPQPPAWARRLVGTPDGAVTIEMDTIATEEDHGKARDIRPERTEHSDEP